ncbi:hypothetical protein MIND_00770600 [Mycena indigotica]|uniref:Uncharacterized protein n=1 Tax=Mycena indigotica TaxID=2126181 RepID=A0A8H6W1Z0_9AGAR|nr:uncharacterized protein MIND_00770600 [Mycena indigotica]KAF7302042.1 hypothetical protein MIND_00770600 [Mycena indigotica]
MRISPAYLLLVVWPILLLVSLPRVIAVQIQFPVTYPGFGTSLFAVSGTSWLSDRLSGLFPHRDKAEDEAESDSFDFWRRTQEKLDGAKREALEAINKATREIGTQVNELKTNIEDLVHGASVLHEIVSPQPQISSGGTTQATNAEVVASNIADDLAAALDVITQELQQMLGLRPSKSWRKIALDKVGDALVRVLEKHGVETSRIESVWEAIIHPGLFNGLILIGDIAEQHPALLSGLLFWLAVMLIPEVWLFQPILRVFGFGKQGPIKGSVAAWAQRVFYGATVEKESWFSLLQQAGMTPTQGTSMETSPEGSRPIPVWSRRYREMNKIPTNEAKGDSSCPKRTATRSIFLGYTCHPTRRSHYFLFIPFLSDDAHTGKLINVSGNPWNSDFALEIKTGFDRGTVQHAYATAPLGSLAKTSHYLYLGQISAADFVDEGSYNIRNEPNARDRIECLAGRIPLPYRAPNATPEDPDDPIWLATHPRFERCQEWTNRLRHGMRP